MGFLSRALRDTFEEKKPDELKADIRLISGCEDVQTSADVSNVHSFRLPDPHGRAGGACTSALLSILYKDEQTPEDTYSFVEVIDKMRRILVQRGYEQVPQFSASKPIDVSVPFDLVPESATGKRRALLFGLNYVGHEQGQLSGCINDVMNMVRYIKNVHGFEEENITIYADDGEHEMPTRDNILTAMKKIVDEAEPGDAIYMHYSGHGAKIADDNGDEEDGYDETLVPLDYQTAGLIRDDDLYELIVKRLPEGVHLVCLFDCCHSGTVLDLPYVLKPGQDEMKIEEKFNFKKLLQKFGAKLDAIFD